MHRLAEWSHPPALSQVAGAQDLHVRPLDAALLPTKRAPGEREPAHPRWGQAGGAGEIDGLAATEVALNQSTAAVTHLRCGYFFTNLLFEVKSLRAG